MSDDEFDEGSAFETPEDESDGDFMKNPTDFSDTVLINERKKLIRASLVVAIAVVAFAIVVYFAVSKYSDNSKPAPTPAATKATPTKGNTPKMVDKPLEYSKAPKVQPGEVKVSVNGKTLSTSSGKSLKFTNVEMVSTQCSTVQVTDFCLAAQSKDTKLGYDVYFVKDAVHSRLFEKPLNFEKVDVKGSPSSGILTIQFSADKQNPVLVTTNKDSSGWMIVVANGTEDTLKKIAGRIEIS